MPGVESWECVRGIQAEYHAPRTHLVHICILHRFQLDNVDRLFLALLKISK